MSSVITPERLRSLFRPRSVALVGASNKSPFSNTAYRNLVEFDFTDRTFLVNRRGVETHGRPTVTSCAEIGQPVDVAFMMVPQAGTLDALTDAAAAGIRNAVILSSGYGEAGEAGRAAQAELVAHAESLDMVLLGPNHLGFANLVDHAPVTPILGLPHEAGSVALLSQSGASSKAMVEFATLSGADLSYMVTLGNEAMITAGHVLDFLVEDEHTKAIAIFMETIREPEVFRTAARRAAAAGKPIVVLKAGSSELSARTAAAHTGALVGDDRTIDAIFRDLGIIRVDSIEDMLITAGTAARLGRLEHSGIGVVSISGGACDILADRAEDLGARFPEFAPGTQEKLAEIMPEYGTVQNPLDVTGAAIIDPTIFTRSIEAVSADPEIGVVAVVNTLPWEREGDGKFSGQAFANAIGAGIQRASGPVVYVNQVLEPITDYTKEVMAEADVPHAIPGLRQAVVALRNLAWWSEATRDAGRGPSAEPRAVRVPESSERRGNWSEASARQLLIDAGIPVVPGTLVGSAEQAVAAAAELAGPVALKIVSPDILHKSDIGGVRLGVAGDEAVAAAYTEVVGSASRVPGAGVEGVLVSPMRSGGTELLIGVARDPQWGPILAVALGGIFVEVLGDSALSPLPVSPAQARELIESLRAAALLRGVRGTRPADLDALAEVVARIGDLALALGGDLESLEVNPLRVDGSTVEALDAVVTWTGKED
ncbi:acetate--CoA ligase family protein [Nocardia jinanensis]|uniref:Pimeloyl-CoA synthetase n=1 Tax=Nocardia jinanensis TaxID=382504 RepID=A0A917RMN6_9NOCA|nr:acetate--CoA ligase family protein [Nocardia jinanensis]GGL16014.1 pimeloyl-CoA synthetase [Nocardia jinanensis]